MKRKGFFITFALVFSLARDPLWAQTSATSHYLPQVADGVQADGTSYTSSLYITNLSGATSFCTLWLYGLSPTRLVGQSTFTVQNGNWHLAATRGQDALASGYARMDCTQPVYANVIYSLSRRDQSTAGMATVFSSPLVRYALLPMRLSPGLNYGIAIANDNDATISVVLRFTGDIGPPIERQVQVLRRSQSVGFVNQYLPLPASGLGTLEILSQSVQQFSVIGLLYSGNVFTTLVPSY